MTPFPKRLQDGVFPAPTFVNKHGLNFFNEDWLKKAQAILVNSFEGEAKNE
jgi:hypothetical protein